MLIRFSVTNFLSIREKQTLDMTAVATCKERLEDNTFNIANSKLLKNVIIYGANASGKSNLFIAMKHMARFVIDSAKESQASEKLRIIPFLLNKNSSKLPSVFEIEFFVGDTHYRYGFEVSQQRFEKEWLFKSKNRREIPLFFRLFDDDHDNIQVEDSFSDAVDIIKMTRENTLFLSACSAWAVREAESIVQYFIQKFHVLSGSNLDGIGAYTASKINDGTLHRQVIDFLSRADMGIQDINVTEKELPEKLVQLLRSQNDFDESPKVMEIKSKHFIYDDNGKKSGYTEFNFDGLESLGTRKAFALAGPIIDAITNGEVIVIDELDSRLHPIFVCQIVAMFNSAKLNAQNAQLIFNTHDTNLLGHKVCKDKSGKKEYMLRRDQIYFAEKDQTEASHYYSLIEFKEEKEDGSLAGIRNDASFESDYLSGRYGAIPFIGQLWGK